MHGQTTLNPPVWSRSEYSLVATHEQNEILRNNIASSREEAYCVILIRDNNMEQYRWQSGGHFTPECKPVPNMHRDGEVGVKNLIQLKIKGFVLEVMFLRKTLLAFGEICDSAEHVLNNSGL